MEPPPRSLALDAHYCIMVRVAWPTEYKYASAIGCACWRAPLGIDSVPTTTCDRRPNAEPMASAFPGSRRGHGRPSNKQRGKTTRTSALTEITPYKCPRGKILRPGNPVAHGRFFYARKRDCDRCALASICLSKGRTSKGRVISHDYPALLRARRRRERWSAADQQLYQRHRWRSEGFHGEAKTWHGLARAVRRGLQNMRIQAYLTASAINLKRLAAALVT